jgi:hypothetical protein
MKTADGTLGNVTLFKDFGITVIIENLIQKAMKGTMNSGKHFVFSSAV